ncbi:MAG TPA: hypothetical protein VHC22_11765 [Pirellulales bacterium]|nr:hypothetical protein [Pirellulales bacterium]
MSLVEEAKKALTGMGSFTASRHVLAVADTGERLESELTTLDRVGCEFTRFVLHADHLSAATIDQLKRVSETLASRLTYLLEPIRPIEQDAEGCVIQMRSVPPQREADVTSYYEVLVRRGGELSLCRWAKAPGDVRQPLPAQVTREVFLRLVGDFSAAAR